MVHVDLYASFENVDVVLETPGLKIYSAAYSSSKVDTGSVRE
jgi:hypothetical protein